MVLPSNTNLQIHRLSKKREGDFFRLHSPVNGCGWCFCVAWWVPTWKGWGDRTSEGNRTLRERPFESGHYDGYLLYIDDLPVGWCQVGARDRLDKITNQFELTPDPETWAITCFLIEDSHRRLGYARFMLGEILKDLRERGVRKVEAFPRRGSNLDELDLWNGPENIFLNAGFEVVHDDPQRPLLRIEF